MTPGPGNLSYTVGLRSMKGERRNHAPQSYVRMLPWKHFGTMLHFVGWFGKGNSLLPALLVLLGPPLYSQQAGLSLRRSCILRAILYKEM